MIIFARPLRERGDNKPLNGKNWTLAVITRDLIAAFYFVACRCIQDFLYLLNTPVP